MSVTSIEIKTESRQRTLRVRIAIAIAVVLTGSFLALEHVSYGWVFVGLGSVAIAALWTRIRYVSMSARIEMKPDRISFINMFWCTFLDVRYSDIHLVERREVRGFGLARIARAGRLPLTIASSAMSSIADFRGFIRELETKTTPGTVVDRSVHQPTAAIVSFSLIALIVTIHVLVWRQGSGLQVMSLLAHGAFSPVLVSDGEWFRLITNAGLHSGWPHLLVNVMLIAFAFGELEERLGHSRILILMVVGGLTASFSSWMFSEHSVLVGASGVGYAALGAIAYLLIKAPVSAPLTFRLLPSWLLIGIAVVDVALGISVQEISFAMHMGGFVAGIVVMAILASTLNNPSRMASRVLNSLAAIGVALVAVGVIGLYQYHSHGNPQRLMLFRLLEDRTPAGLINSAAYQLALNPQVSARELRTATQRMEKTIVLPSNSAREIAAYRDTAATLNARIGNTTRASDLELEALEGASSLPVDQQAETPIYAAHLAQFDTTAHPSVVTGVAVYSGEQTICLDLQKGHPATSVRAVLLRGEKPTGLLLIPNTARLNARCLPAASVAPTDIVRITHVDKPALTGDARFYPVRAEDANLPEFILHPSIPTK